MGAQHDHHPVLPAAQVTALRCFMVSVIYSIWLVRRDPGLGDRFGSIAADV